MDMGDSTVHDGTMLYFHFTEYAQILWQEWNPTTAGAMVGSCIVIVIWAIVFDGCKQFREWLSRREYGASSVAKTVHTAGGGMMMSESTDPIVNKPSPPITWQDGLTRRHHLIQTGLYLVQTFFGYCLMLIAMYFNFYMFLSVVVGITLSYYLFAWPPRPNPATTDNEPQNCDVIEQSSISSINQPTYKVTETD
ncbi:protein SLC31A2-like [Glandiceps talaboti]